MSAAKQRIIETASDLFYRKGYNSTGIDEVIREAGVAKATLYAHFRSKKDLCIDYLQHRNTQYFANLDTFLESYPQGAEQVLGVFDFLAAFYETKEFAGCWAVRTASEVPEADEDIRSEVVRQKTQLMAYLEVLLKHAESAAPKRMPSARQVYLLYEGAVTESFIHSEAWPITEAKAICARMLELD